MTTWSIDYAFMIDTGDLCTREEMERVGWDKTRDTVLVSEDLATGGIRVHLVSAKGNGDPWIAGKIKDDIEEFGYGGAPVRIKSDQEPAIVDVQRAVIAKRGNAPTIPLNSPVGDSQSNGRVENAINKVRNMVKTILSSLESRWGIRVARDHPVYPWVFEWPADLMTRYAHLGDLGKTAVQLIRGSKSSRNIAQFGEKILYKPLKLSGHHRGNMEDTFLDGIFKGMRLRSDEILLEQPEELSRRAHCDDELKKNNGTLNSPSPSKENLDNLFLGSTATTFLQQFQTEQEYAWKKISRMLVWHNRVNLLIHGKHEKFRCHQTDLLPKYVQIC